MIMLALGIKKEIPGIIAWCLANMDTAYGLRPQTAPIICAQLRDRTNKFRFVARFLGALSLAFK